MKIIPTAMNKNNWTYRKLGEVATLVADGDWIESKDQSEQGIRLIQTGNIGNGFFKSKDDKPHFISEETMSRLNCTEIFQGDCLVSRLPDPVGRACLIPNIGCRMITAVDCSIIRFSNDYLPQFFVDYSQSAKYRNSVNNNTTGTTRKRISRKNLEKIPIPIPPLAEQQRIVAELDLLSSIIEKKKAQLKELDQLAQSIFYDMFGDPITNEKGWEVKKLKEVSTLINGRAYKQNELLNEGKYKVLRVGNFFTNSNYYYSDLELEDNKYCDNGDLLFAWSASFGAFIWCGEKVIYHYHIWKVLYDEKQLNKIFYCNLLNTMTNAFMNDVHGIGMVHLTKQGMEDYILPLPPLPLQQEFASKIEAIERQKTLIQQSIDEVQTLFDSRMDYWFG